jgi:uncharacterized protein YidB (DUF937 family)
MLDDIKQMVGGKGDITDLAAIASKNPELVAAAAGLLGSKAKTGGFDGLMDSFRRSGLDDAVSSWLGNGANKSVTADQVKNAIGDDSLTEFAQKAGLSLADAGPALAAVLPSLIDKLSPEGKMPDVASLEGAVAAILGKPN